MYTGTSAVELNQTDESPLRLWLYRRLSRDEDVAMNSLNNQRDILLDYTGRINGIVVGESFDDNMSGMNFVSAILITAWQMPTAPLIGSKNICWMICSMRSTAPQENGCIKLGANRETNFCLC